jgi:hypothetical protein
MNNAMAKLTISGLLFVISRLTGPSQGFVNLDFEDAQIVPIAGSPYFPYGIATTNGLPGWTVFYGTNQQTAITYNDPSLGATWVTLYATNGEQIGGDFSVLLQGGGVGTIPTDASISQTGIVPVGTVSLLFEAQPGLGPLLVSLGSQNVAFSALASSSNYTLYGANVSSFAGLTEELTFSASYLDAPNNNWNIDDIEFSSMSVPEPSAADLCVMSFLFLGWRRWNSRT